MTRRRILLLLAIGAYVAAALVWLAADRRIAKETFTAGSALSTADDGTSLLIGYLRTTRRGATMLTREITPESLPRNAVVFRIAPLWSPQQERFDAEQQERDEERMGREREESPRRRARKAATPEPHPNANHERHMALLGNEEEAFVRRGGRIVLAIDTTYGTTSVRAGSSATATRSFPLVQGVDTLTLPRSRTLASASLERGYSLYTVGNRSAITRVPIGRGDVIVSAAPELFENAYVGVPNNLRFALALAEGRPVYFDEMAHGVADEQGVTSILAQWGFGPMLVCIAGALLLLFWRRGTRVGAADEESPDRRSEAVDLVHAIGALYSRALTNGDAIALYHQALTRAVASQSGLRGEALHERVAALTDGTSFPDAEAKLSTPQFQRLLDILNDSFRKVNHGKHQ